jgi:3-deoxy-D-manno-octulosonic-acid transferase
MRFFYNISVRVYGLAIKIAAHFNGKAKLWVKGREHWRESLQNELQKREIIHKRLIWMHAASLGEFEQGKPILTALKIKYPDYKIVVSFFSPSGFEAAKSSKIPDLIFYLPLDTPSNSSDLVKILNPSIALWIKYEYWWNHLEAIKQYEVPLLLISAIFQKRQPFFKWYGFWQRKMLRVFTHLFVQTEQSLTLTQKFISLDKISFAGDTRFDRVKEIAESWSPIPMIEEWIANTEWVVVAGSTWPDDEKALKLLIESNNSIKWIIAPHKLDENSLNETLKILPSALKYTQLIQNTSYLKMGGNVLLFDTMGMLSRLYKYGKICYIGGGLSGTGLHNTLEAAVYGKPLYFGDDYANFAEAVDLINIGAAVSIKNALQVEKEISELIINRDLYEKRANAALKYTRNKTGATTKIVDYIYKNRLLTRE